MQEFVHRANIAEFCKLLSTTTDDYRRRTLLRLLAEEEANAPPVIKEFVRKANIAEFCNLLATTTDEYQRRILLQLVAEEEAKGAADPLSSKESQTRVNAALSPTLRPPSQHRPSATASWTRQRP